MVIKSVELKSGFFSGRLCYGGILRGSIFNRQIFIFMIKQ